MPRPPCPDDLYSLRLPTEVRLSPDGRRVAFSLKTSAPRRDGYRSALWTVVSDGTSEPRQMTLGARNDTAPRWSPDGSTLAFLSDRGAVLTAGGAGEQEAPPEPGEGAVQVWLLPVAGGEARQLTSLPSDVSDIAWSPDGRLLCVVSPALTAARDGERRRPEDPPKSDIRHIDRLQYQLNGVGFTYDRPANLWLVEVADGAARRLTRGRSQDEAPRWSPDGERIAFVSNRHPDADLSWRTDIYTVHVGGGAVSRVSGGRGERSFGAPAWSPDGSAIAAIGHRFPAGDASRAGVWLFDAQEAREDQGVDLSAATDLMVGASMNSDLFGAAEPSLHWSADGARILFGAPIEGSYELWRVGVETRDVERVTEGRHFLSRQDAVALPDGGQRMAAVRTAGNAAPDVVTLDLPSAPLEERTLEPRRLTNLMAEAWGEIELVEPVERWHEVDGRRIQGWYLGAAGSPAGAGPLVVEIHGGPATLYGWSLMWEWQCLVARGMSVYACNPRGSQGYGEDFCHANFRDWGDGPMRDVIAGVDASVADGLANRDALGVTGGSYGGYLTSWIVGHTDRFRAACSARSVNDMTSQMLSGDIGGPTFGKFEYGANPWEDPELYRRHSPLSYAANITTPLLIQHAEKDLRTTITQAEELFSVLRSLHRTVRLMRVPEESHELTRSGAPFRRVDNLARIVEWFEHFLVQGKEGLPPVPPVPARR